MTEYLSGTLYSGRARLRREAASRRRTVERVSVPLDDAGRYLERGFAQVRRFSHSIRLEREKPIWRRLEDDIWLLLYRFGFDELSGEERFRLLIQRRLSPKEDSLYEVDVFGRADDNVFVVECTTSQNPQRRSMAPKINRIVNYRSRINSSVRKHFDDRGIKVSHVLATRGIDWKDSDRAEASENKIHVWADPEYQYLDSLADLSDLIGEAVRYQLLAVMFGDQKIRGLEDQRVAAIKGKAGSRVYYSFLATPEQILRISYVHRRVGPLGDLSYEGMTEAYQRLLRASKIRQIREYVDGGEVFPNSVILNLRRKPKFESTARGDLDFPYGILTLPNSYGSAWIIDGQHRLFGYAKSERRLSSPLPVLAFENLDIAEQAQLFVDINQKQTKVPPNLLWDLKGDIYEGSGDPKQRIEYVISHVVRMLNANDESPLKGRVNVPSAGNIRRGNVTMTTLCQGIKKNRLIDPEVFGDQPMDLSTARFAAERLQVFFSVVEGLLSEDWDRGQEGYTRSNDGLAALLIVLRQVVRYLYGRGQRQLYARSNLTEFRSELESLLSPALDHLSSATVIGKFKRRFGVGGQLDSAQELCWRIRDRFAAFPLPRHEELPPNVEDVEPEPPLVDELLTDTEISLRNLIAKRLEERHGSAWYRRGLPDGVKRKIDERIEQEFASRPYLRAEIETNPIRKLEYLDLGDLKDTMLYGDNLPIFAAIFGENRGNLEHQFGYYIDLRNARAHARSVEEELWLHGRGAIIWIRRCMNL